jgi:hypothetical protein
MSEPAPHVHVWIDAVMTAGNTPPSAVMVRASVSSATRSTSSAMTIRERQRDDHG